MADRPRSLWRVAAVALVALIMAALLVLVLNPEAAGAPRRWVKWVDRAVLGSFLHRQLLDDPATDEAMLDVPPPRAGAYEWADGHEFLAIAHALGPSLHTGPNTLATFEQGRAMGFTFFEVDLVMTADDVLACHHGRAGENLDALTWADIRARSPEACRFEALVAMAAERPEVRFVLDVKNRFHDAYDAMERLTRASGVTGSFIPQLYHFAQLRRFRETPGFEGVIFTAYRSALPLATVFGHARRAGVAVVTVPVERLAAWDGELPDEPLILTHPVNDPFQAWQQRRRGADGIYTSYLTRWTAPDVWGPDAPPPRP